MTTDGTTFSDRLAALEHGVDQREEVQCLFGNLKMAEPKLSDALRICNSECRYADGVYRFYHQSFKVFDLQRSTIEMVQLLRDLAPDRPLHPWFEQIIAEGTTKEMSPEANARWLETTRPILEAFFHAKFMLEMAVQSAHALSAPPLALPSNWAALLYLYRLR
jgi:hypothetical protein